MNVSPVASDPSGSMAFRDQLLNVEIAEETEQDCSPLCFQPTARGSQELRNEMKPEALVGSAPEDQLRNIESVMEDKRWSQQVTFYVSSILHLFTL